MVRVYCGPTPKNRAVPGLASAIFTEGGGIRGRASGALNLMLSTQNLTGPIKSVLG